MPTAKPVTKRAREAEIASPTSERQSLLLQTILAVLIVAAVLLVCWPARGGFLWDDFGFFLDNPLIENPHGLRRLWLTTESQDYFVLTSTMLWGEWKLWGMNPVGYHIVNALIHAGCAVVLWRVLRRLKIPGAWLGAMLFAVHPVAMLSAAWITEGKNTLSLFFYLLSVWLWLVCDDNRRASAYALSLFAFALALLAKGSVVVLPFVILLCAWWRRGRLSRRDLKLSLPYFALALAMGLVTIWFQNHNAIRGTVVRPEGIASRIAAAGWIFWFYLCKLLAPLRLTAIYPRWNVDAAMLYSWLPLAAVVCLIIVFWRRRKGHGRPAFFAFGYFIIALLPVAGFLDMSFMPLSLVSDHFQYVAMVGITALAGAILYSAMHAKRARWIAATVAAAVVVALGYGSWGRSALCGREIAFWKDNVAKNPNAWLAWTNLAEAYSRAKDPKEAFTAADRAIEIMPIHPGAFFSRAQAEASMGLYDRAIGDFRKSLEKGATNLSQIHNSMATTYAQMGKYEDALAESDLAIKAHPDRAFPYNNRGTLLGRMGRLDEAIQDYTQAIKLKPGFAEAYYNRAKVYSMQDSFDQAIDDYTAAIRAGGTFAYSGRARAYEMKGEYDRALEDVKEMDKLGVKVDPQFVQELLARKSRAAQKE